MRVEPSQTPTHGRIFDTATLTEGCSPSKANVANATRLLKVLDGRVSKPSSTGTGYWPTTCLRWADDKFEIEVFDDGYELCQFDPIDHASITILDFEATSVGLAALIAALGLSDQPQPETVGH